MIMPPPFPHPVIVAGLAAAAGVLAKALAAKNVHVVVNIPPGAPMDADAIREAVADGVAAGLSRADEDE